MRQAFVVGRPPGIHRRPNGRPAQARIDPQERRVHPDGAGLVGNPRAVQSCEEISQEHKLRGTALPRTFVNFTDVTSFTQLHIVPEPPFDVELRTACGVKLLSSLADLMNVVSKVDTEDESKSARVTGAAADGELWVVKVLNTVVGLEKDKKHVQVVQSLDDDTSALVQEVMKMLDALSSVREYFMSAVSHSWKGHRYLRQCASQREEPNCSLPL